jgi:hypothetical protein
VVIGHREVKERVEVGKKREQYATLWGREYNPAARVVAPLGNFAGAYSRIMARPT